MVGWKGCYLHDSAVQGCRFCEQCSSGIVPPGGVVLVHLASQISQAALETGDVKLTWLCLCLLKTLAA